ncbi:hypothetical protein [Rhizobium sp. BK176]|uniref:hypothetical protein n=1 Tax=Rhizobium sp. BK176 TaxID=2587071 RepID=UPI00216742CD|nr:hypothetical protein [Rhizobium sp. BK176]MCS4088523.1 hypothetical protein [Rhizobium sp. BK176]
MAQSTYRSPEGRLKAIRLHPLVWRFGYRDRGDWISLSESSYYLGPVEIVVDRDTMITSRGPNWRGCTWWPRVRDAKRKDGKA